MNKLSLNHSDYDKGFEAGFNKTPSIAPATIQDRLAWYSGFIEGKAKRKNRNEY